jgi:hypothetical protein
LEEKGGDLQVEEHHPNREARAWQPQVLGCFAAGGTGELHKIDCTMRKDNYVDILKQHLKASVGKFKLGRKCVFQMDIVPKHTSNVVAK